MPIVIKDVGTLGAKYVQRATNAVDAYKAGVTTPKTSQSAAAIAAAPLWQQSVTSPGALARFKSKLQAAGDGAWSQGALNKGANNYPTGVRMGQNKWQTNVQPYLALISGLTLPPKGIRGSDANIARVQAVASALHAAKMAKG